MGCPRGEGFHWIMKLWDRRGTWQTGHAVSRSTNSSPISDGSGLGLVLVTQLPFCSIPSVSVKYISYFWHSCCPASTVIFLLLLYFLPFFGICTHYIVQAAVFYVWSVCWFNCKVKIKATQPCSVEFNFVILKLLY